MLLNRSISISVIVLATISLSDASATAENPNDDLVPGLVLPSASTAPHPASTVSKPPVPESNAPQPANNGMVLNGKGSMFRLRAVRPDQDTPWSFDRQSKPDASVSDPTAIIETSKGTFKIRLFRQLAPITVANFVDLAGKSFYNGLIFHRFEPGFCIQGGDPSGTGMGSYTDPATHQTRVVPLEVSPKLSHNAPGVVALARSADPNSGSCQFYITLAATPFLDGHYAIFGGVLSGMDVVQQLRRGDKIKSITVQETQ